MNHKDQKCYNLKKIFLTKWSIIKIVSASWAWGLMPVIQTTREAEIKRIAI
jgi:hypothetical protein